MDSVLAWLSNREAFTVVQIGAYVGDTPTDPLYEFLQGTLPGHPERVAVLVEPVREYFDQLQNAYGGLPNVSFENVAITEVAGDRDLHRLASSVDPTAHGFPAWLSETSSLLPDWITQEESGQSQELKDFSGNNIGQVERFAAGRLTSCSIGTGSSTLTCFRSTRRATTMRSCARSTSRDGGRSSSTTERPGNARG